MSGGGQRAVSRPLEVYLVAFAWHAESTFRIRAFEILRARASKEPKPHAEVAKEMQN